MGENTLKSRVYERKVLKSDWKFTLAELRVKNTILMIFIHAMGLYGLSYITNISWGVFFYGMSLWIFSGFGITAGYHRMWSHKSFKAKLPLRLFLLFWGTMAGEGSVIWWCRDHRIHHPYSETEADPHNAERGIFYSHIGWLLVKRPKEVLEAGKKVDLTDLKADPFLRWQHQIYTPLSLFVSYFIPCYLGSFFTDDIKGLFWFACAFRHMWTLNCTFTVNSLAHFIGERDYDSRVSGTENLAVSILALGEGHHNYHHKYPYDWKTSEHMFCVNPTAWFIKAMSIIGLAYDLKEASHDNVQRGLKRSQLYNSLKDAESELKSLKTPPSETEIAKFINETDLELKMKFKTYDMSLREIRHTVQERMESFMKVA